MNVSSSTDNRFLLPPFQTSEKRGPTRISTLSQVSRNGFIDKIPAMLALSPKRLGPTWPFPCCSLFTSLRKDRSDKWPHLGGARQGQHPRGPWQLLRERKKSRRQLEVFPQGGSGGGSGADGWAVKGSSVGWFQIKSNPSPQFVRKPTPPSGNHRRAAQGSEGQRRIDAMTSPCLS